MVTGTVLCDVKRIAILTLTSGLLIIGSQALEPCIKSHVAMLERQASTAFDNENYQQAEQYWQEAREESSKFPNLQADCAVASTNLAYSMYHRNDKHRREIEDLLQQAISMTHPDSFDLSWELGILGKFYMHDGQYLKAEAALRKSLNTIRVVDGNDASTTAICMHNLAHCCNELGKKSEAKALFKKSIAIQQRCIQQGKVDVNECRIGVAASMAGLAQTFDTSQGRDAIALYKGAITLLEKNPLRRAKHDTEHYKNELGNITKSLERST